MPRSGIDLGHGEPGWIVTKERSKWDAIFQVPSESSSSCLTHFILQSLGPHKGRITGSTAKKEMVKSRLPNPVLAKIWRLADVDQVTSRYLRVSHRHARSGWAAGRRRVCPVDAPDQHQAGRVRPAGRPASPPGAPLKEESLQRKRCRIGLWLRRVLLT